MADSPNADPPRATLELLPSGPNDAYYDYCLEPYRPRRPSAGKLRSENLFWHGLACMGTLEALAPPVRALQASLGNDLTVWGLKWDGARLFSEIYLYDPQKEDPDATLSAVTRTFSPWLEVVPRVDERVPYMMVSLDLDEKVATSKRIESVNLYLTGETGHAGRAYELSRGDLELTNTYRFFQAKPEAEQVLALIKASAFVDFSARDTLSKVIPPQLFACKKICVSKKRRADGIYFSGIAVDQLLWFLRAFSYPPVLVDLIAKHESQLEHLYFDVGIDYRWDPVEGRLRYLKSSYYGTL